MGACHLIHWAHSRHYSGATQTWLLACILGGYSVHVSIYKRLVQCLFEDVRRGCSNYFLGQYVPDSECSREIAVFICVQAGRGDVVPQRVAGTKVS